MTTPLQFSCREVKDKDMTQRRKERMTRENEWFGWNAYVLIVVFHRYLYYFSRTWGKMANDVTILSVNCRGLADTKKRNDVFHYLKRKKYSIYCLQETHFTEEMHSMIKSKWGFKAFF